MKLFRACWRALVVAALSCIAVSAARANPALAIDVDTGEVLYQDMATAPWYPASLTKLMTTYVALSKVREGKLSLDTPLRVSTRAARMAPSKMGFRPGTLVTLDNALKMLMVKSPNDVAVTVAEGVSGSVEAFADEMNAYGEKLGLRESHFMNPNGLPDERHVSSARDMAIIGRALLRDFPEEHDLFGIGALSFAGRIIKNHNGLLGRYDGVDGMKTGYTCSAGYNIVASAERGGKHLIVVVMGAPTLDERSLKVVTLFERSFAGTGGGGGDVANLPASDIVLPPDMRGQICGPGRQNAIMEAEAEDAAIPPAPGGPLFGRSPERAQIFGLATAPAPWTIAASGPAQALGLAGGLLEMLHPRAPFQPVRVYIGPAPGWNGGVAGPVEVAAPGPKVVHPPALALARPDIGGPPAFDPALPPPMALAGAVAASPALAATNLAVKAKGRLSMRVTSPRPARGGKHGAQATAKPAARPVEKPKLAAGDVAKKAHSKSGAAIRRGKPPPR